jgi:anti-sigma factor RsiW
MSCEKYSGRLTDAALGELRAEHETELLAHALECEACREALGHARAVRDFVDRGVESLVAGEPSPRLAAQLRRRIAQECESPRFSWMAWGPVMAGALALATVLVIMFARRPMHTTSDPSVASAVSPLSALPAASATSGPRSQDAARTPGQRHLEQSALVRTAATALPEIIVPKGQLIAAMRLSVAIDSGQVDGKQLLAAGEQYRTPLEVKPIEIAPLETPALDAATEKSAGSIPF